MSKSNASPASFRLFPFPTAALHHQSWMRNWTKFIGAHRSLLGSHPTDPIQWKSAGWISTEMHGTGWTKRVSLCTTPRHSNGDNVEELPGALCPCFAKKGLWSKTPISSHLQWNLGFDWPCLGFNLPIYILALYTLNCLKYTITTCQPTNRWHKQDQKKKNWAEQDSHVSLVVFFIYLSIKNFVLKERESSGKTCFGPLNENENFSGAAAKFTNNFW